MKQGQTLVEFAQQIEREQRNQMDFVFLGNTLDQMIASDLTAGMERVRQVRRNH